VSGSSFSARQIATFKIGWIDGGIALWGSMTAEPFDLISVPATGLILFMGCLYDFTASDILTISSVVISPETEARQRSAIAGTLGVKRILVHSL
jgi:hypothetical protein